MYVQNLEERVKIPQLSGLLRTLFSEFGTVVDIVARKNLKAKGQAFIVYDDPANAKSAIDELQGFKLFDKPMRLSLAKSRSDKSVEIASSSEVYELYKRNRLAEKGIWLLRICVHVIQLYEPLCSNTIRQTPCCRSSRQ